MNKFSDSNVAYALARIGLGVNFAVHGGVRLPKLDGFAQGVVDKFSETFLPQFSVTAFAYSLPILELLIGLLLVIGWRTRIGLIAGGLVMISLLFGTCLIENWGTAGSQLIYLGFFSGLLALRERFNVLSIDGIVQRS